MCASIWYQLSRMFIRESSVAGMESVGIIGIPGPFCFPCLFKKQDKAIQWKKGDRDDSGSPEGQLIFVKLNYSCYLNKSSYQLHEVDVMIFPLEIRKMRLRNVEKRALYHKMWCGRAWYWPRSLDCLCCLSLPRGQWKPCVLKPKWLFNTSYGNITAIVIF